MLYGVGAVIQLFERKTLAELIVAPDDGAVMGVPFIIPAGWLGGVFAVDGCIGAVIKYQLAHF